MSGDLSIKEETRVLLVTELHKNAQKLNRETRDRLSEALRVSNNEPQIEMIMKEAFMKIAELPGR